MLVFLDLEETLISDWSHGMLLPRKISAVRKLLAANPGVRVGLMSWAVWDGRDLERFKWNFQHELESLLAITFDPELLWTMDDWAMQVFLHHRKKVSREDMFDMFGKQEVLFTLGRKHPLFNGHEVLLVDDAIEHNMQLHIPSNNCTIKFINVDDLVKEK